MLKPESEATLRVDAPADGIFAEGRDGASLLKTFTSFIKGGHVWVAGGVLLLFIAFALLLTYMASRGMFTVEMRIVCVALAGIVMLAFGWRFRERKPVYSLVLQGGGIGLLYMAVFASVKLTTLIAPMPGLVLISLLVPPTIILAIRQNSQPLGMFGLLGGFAAPILLSTDSGNYVALFTFYSVLNLAVLVIGHYRLWRGLNLVAFVCTFGVALTWVLGSYEPEMFAKAEPFMVLFVAMFTYLGVQSVKDRAIYIKNFVDLPLTVGTPFLGAVIQWRIFSYIEHGLPLVCIIFSAVYLLLTFIIWKRKGVSMRSLAEGFLALSVLLANLAIPLEMSAEATSAVWAAEGVLIFYLGARFQSTRIKIFGLAFHIAAAIAFAVRDTYKYYDQVFGAFRDPTFVGCLIIALAAIITAVLASRFKQPLPATGSSEAGVDEEQSFPGLTAASEKLKTGSLAPVLSKILIVWGFIWWFAGWWVEFDRIYDYPSEQFFILASATALAGFALSRFLRCPPLAWSVAGPLLFAFLFVGKILLSRMFYTFGYNPLNILTYNFFEGLFLWGWLLFAASQGMILLVTRKSLPERLRPSVHALWMFVFLLLSVIVLTCTGRAYTQIWNLSESWASLAGILPALVFVICLAVAATRKSELPSPHRKVMLLALPAILTLSTTVWFVGTLFSAGDPDPLPIYIPLVNPLELMQAFCIATIALWQIHARKAGNIPALSQKGLLTLIDVMVFFWLTAMVARAIHFFLDIPMSAVPHSGKFQLALLVLWGLYGIAHIVAGHRLPMRRAWVAGASLMLIDIGKLLLVDLAHTGTITRIISFFVAGLLLLFIGWVAPLPPASGQLESKDKNESTANSSL